MNERRRITMPCGVRMLRSALLGAVAGLVLPGQIARAVAPPDTYPDRPIRIVAAFAGVTGQTLLRVLAEKLEPLLGQSIAIDPRPGASGNIANDIVAGAAPDGHTLLLVQATTTVLPSTHGGRAVDPVRAFAPIMRLATQPLAFVVHRSTQAASLAGLIEAARERPGRIEYSSPGIGTINHLAAEMLWTRAGVQLLHVPYSTSTAAMKDAVTGLVPVTISVPATADPFVRNGELRMLALTSLRRSSTYPGVPTVAEAGYPDFETESWYGLVAPAGTPPAITGKIHRAIAPLLERRDVRERLTAIGLEIAPSTPEQLGQLLRAEVERWSAVTKAIGINAKD